VRVSRQVSLSNLSHDLLSLPHPAVYLAAMKEREWRVWLNNLPSERDPLQQLRLEIGHQAVLAESRIDALQWERVSKPQERALRVAVNEFNSQLLLLDTRIKATELTVMSTRITSSGSARAPGDKH
jgi:hypothetical protein